MRIISRFVSILAVWSLVLRLIILLVDVTIFLSGNSENTKNMSGNINPWDYEMVRVNNFICKIRT